MIVNAQQYISSRCARRIDCTVSVPYYDFMAAVYCRDVFFFISAAKCHCNRAYWSHELARRAKEMSL